MGVIYQSPSGDTVEGRTHAECETAIRAKGVDPAACAIELTEITDEVNPWRAVAQTQMPERCTWA